MDWPEITNDTTVEEVFEIHRRIWDEVIEKLTQNGVVCKPDTPYREDCALCEYSDVHALLCRYCPADWGTDKDGYPIKCTKNLDYRLYSLGYDNEETLEAIKRIRNIPRKKI